MQINFLNLISNILREIIPSVLYNRERQVVSAQSRRIDVLLDGKQHDRVVISTQIFTIIPMFGEKAFMKASIFNSKAAVSTDWFQ